MTFVAPQLCQPSTALPTGSNWSFEEKADGFRGLVTVNDTGEIRIFTRRGHDWTNKFPRLVANIQRLRLPAVVLDGEIVALGINGRTDFRHLTARLHHGDVSAYIAFDLLRLQGERTTALPLAERRQRLHQLVPFASSEVVAAPVHLDGISLLASVELSGGEGIVAKDISAPYWSGGRPSSWRKIKLHKRAELIVIGWRPDAVGRLKSIGVASFEGNTLRSRGWIGCGFTMDERASLPKLFARHEIGSAPRSISAQAPPGARWLNPVYRAEVRMDAVTGDGTIRGAAYLRLRDRPLSSSA